MKTPHKQNDVAARTQGHDAKTRAKRTAAKFACESLEGRNLMTGFAGAGAMMGHGPVEMGGMGDSGGGDFQRHDRMDRSGGPDAGSAQADATGTATDSGTSGTTATTGSTTPNTTGSTAPQGWTPTFAHDGRADGDFDAPIGRRGGRVEGGFGDSMRGDKGDADDVPLAGFSGQGGPGDRMGGDFGGQGRGDAPGAGIGGGSDDSFGPMGGDRGGDRAISFAGPGGHGDSGQDSGQDSTGSAQLKTDMEKLQTDEQAIHDKSQVTPALMAAVRKDLDAIDAAKTGSASDTATQQLKTDEQTIFGSPDDSSSATSSSTAATPAMPTTPPTLTDAQKATLQADHDAILKSEGVSQDLIDQLAKDQLAVKTATNFTDADQATLDADHKAIQTDFAALRSADSTTPPTGSTTAVPTATSATTAVPTATSATAATPTTAATSDATAASAATPTTTDATPPAAPAPTNAAPLPSAPAPAPTAAPPASPTATATQSLPSMPNSAPTDMTARAHMNHHRGGMGGSDAHFMHQVSTADHFQTRSASGTARAEGFGMSGGTARRDFRR